jgi:uncharacterized protein
LSDGGLRHIEIVRLLIEAGADMTFADAEGIMPLAHAQRRGFVQIIELLKKAGAR